MTRPGLNVPTLLAMVWVFIGPIATSAGLGAAATIATTSLLIIVLPATFTTRQRMHGPVALVVFVLIAVAWSILGPHYKAGVQNICIYVSFAVALRLSAVSAEAQTPRRIMRGLTFASLASAVVYLAGIVSGVFTATVSTTGASGLYDPRPFSMIALIGVACAIPYVTRPRDWLIPVLLTIAIAVSQSRTSLAIAILLFTAAGLRRRQRAQGVRLFGWLALEALAAWYLFTRFTPIASRFQHNDNRSFLGISGTTGRSDIWSFVWSHTVSNPLALWFGHGAGSVEHLITTQYENPSVVHPHDDYLRLLYDYGVLGLAFWIVSLGVLAVGAARRLRRATAPDDRIVHLGAALSLALLAGEGLTANAIVYMFVMLPVAVLNGTSIGLAAYRRRQREQGLTAGNSAALAARPPWQLGRPANEQLHAPSGQ